MHREILTKVEEKSALIGVIGLGYVGLPLIRAFINAGFGVIGYDTDDKKVAALEAAFRSRAEAMAIKVGSFLAPVRVAITGRPVSPPLFESMHVLGREESLARIDNARQALHDYAATLA